MSFSGNKLCENFQHLCKLSSRVCACIYVALHACVCVCVHMQSRKISRKT